MSKVVIVGPTVTLAEPETVPVIAEIVAVPTATPVTTPVVLTVATVLSEEDHSNVTPINCAPFWSNATAKSCAVRPTAMFAAGVPTVTDATVELGPLAALPLQDTAPARIRQNRTGRRTNRIWVCDRKGISERERRAKPVRATAPC